MPATQASIPFMGLRMERGFKEKKKFFIFSFKTFFPTILSNHREKGVREDTEKKENESC
jgi:hypothetical protein